MSAQELREDQYARGRGGAAVAASGEQMESRRTWQKRRRKGKGERERGSAAGSLTLSTLA